MNPQRLLFLLLVLLALAAGIGWLALREDPDKQPQLPQAAADALMAGRPKDLRMLRIERPRYGQRVAFRFDQDAWTMVEPIDDEADIYAVSAALEVLFGNDYRPPLPIYSAQTSEQLGLDNPETTIEMEWADGSTSWLRIGAQEVAGDFRVAQRADDLLRLPIPAFRRLNRAVEDWRNHRLQPFGVALTEVIWEPTVGQPLRLENRGRRWRLMEPQQAPLADPAHDMLLSLLGARLIGMGMEEYDFDDVQEVTGLLTLHRGKEQVRIKITRDLGLLSDQRPYSLTVDPHQLRFLSLPLEEILSPRLLDFDPETVASMKLEQGSQQADFHRAAGSWADRADQPLDAAPASFLDALLRYAQGLERGTAQALPASPPAGRILFSISRRPQERGATILRWWVQDDGTILVADGKGSLAFPSSINFEAGVRDLFETLL